MQQWAEAIKPDLGSVAYVKTVDTVYRGPYGPHGENQCGHRGRDASPSERGYFCFLLRNLGHCMSQGQ